MIHESERMKVIENILDEVKKHKNDNGEVECYPSYDQEALKLVDDGHVDWLYERVQELEEIKDAKIVLVNKGDEEKRYVEQEKMIELEKAFDELDSSYIDEVKKNQRYREAIEKARYELESDEDIIDCARNAYWTLGKVLEQNI